MSEGFRVGPVSDPDRYALGQPVGAGAEGILYRGTITVDSGTVLDVAVKMLHPNHRARMAEWHRRWTEQVELLRSLQAPGVVAVRDGFIGPLPHAPGTAMLDDPITLYLVMNWVDGESLDTWAAEHADAAPAELLKLLLPVAGALDLMHSGQATGGTAVIHGDVKPANILVQPDGEAILVDFGLVRSLPGGSRLTGVAGTPGYMAPEVARDGIYTPAADRYALGGVAYFLITGDELPTDHDDASLRQRLASARPGQQELVEHVMAMLALDPGARPHVLANWCAQLRNSSLDPALQADALPPMASSRRDASGTPVPGDPDTDDRSGPIKRRRLAAGAAVGVAAALVLAGMSAAQHDGSGPAMATKSGPASTTSSTTSAARPAGPETSGEAPVAAEPPTTPAPAAVLGNLICRNEYLGYEVNVPATLSISPESPFLGPCEGFSFGRAWRAPTGSSALVGDDIVLTRLEPSTDDVIASFGTPELRRSKASISGHDATVLEHDLGSYPHVKFITTYVMNDGETTLVAQLATSPKEARSHPERRQVLEAMMASIVTRPSTCRNSQDQRCGPFVFDPAPPPNQPLAIELRMTPEVVHVNEDVTFTVWGTDPDAELITVPVVDIASCDGAVALPLTDELSPVPAVLRVVRERSSTPRPSGPWDPPPQRPGEKEFSFRCRYSLPGPAWVRFSLESKNGAAPAGHDPFASRDTVTRTFEVLPSE